MEEVEDMKEEMEEPPHIGGQRISLFVPSLSGLREDKEGG